jgi:carboxypeptidase PM20D1
MAWLRFVLTAGLVVGPLGVAALGGIVLLRAWWWPSRQADVEVIAPVAIDERGAIDRLAGALRCATITAAEPDRLDHAAFEAFHRHLELAFPRVHSILERDVVAGPSLLFTWKGADPALAPLLLSAHQDVVPVEPATLGRWTHGPFSGDVAAGYVWGRGALDMKGSLVGMLEAVETLLGEGFRPRRTVFLAFGHDEEVGGVHGAAAIAERLRLRGVRCGTVLDEGGAITEGIVPGVGRPVALIGIAEKRAALVELTAEAPPGHASMPPSQTAINILAAALRAVEQSPMPAGLDGPTGLMFDWLGPEMAFPQRLVFANRWLLDPLILGKLSTRPTTNAAVRTTLAPTVIAGGETSNVLPAAARAVISVRIKPGDSLDAVLAHIRRAVADDRVQIRSPETGHLTTASKVSSVDSAGFRAIARAVREVLPGAAVAPALTVTAGDSRHYTDLADDIYRLLPYTFRGPGDTARVHGIDERIAVADYHDCVRFYIRLIRNLDTEERGTVP